MHTSSRKESNSERNRKWEATTLAGSKRESRDRTHKSLSLRTQSIINYWKKYMKTTTGFTDTPERKHAEEACRAGKGERIFGAMNPFVSLGIVPLTMKSVIPGDNKHSHGIPKKVKR